MKVKWSENENERMSVMKMSDFYDAYYSLVNVMKSVSENVSESVRRKVNVAYLSVRRRKGQKTSRDDQKNGKKG